MACHSFHLPRGLALALAVGLMLSAPLAEAQQSLGPIRLTPPSGETGGETSGQGGGQEN
jgi:hypothetical protein